MRKKLAPVMETPLPAAEGTLMGCQHHWIIDSPHGPESQGVCRKCGTRKAFQNTIRSFIWEDDFQGRGKKASPSETS